MSALDGLLRLGRWQLEERRRQLSDLEALAAKLAEARAALQRDEARAADIRDLVERRARLEQSEEAVVQQMLLAKDALAESLRDVRRQEAAADARTAKLRRPPLRTARVTSLESFRGNGQRRRG